MCSTCNKARKMPTKQALEYIAQKMGKGSPCLDRLIGELVGEPEPEVDEGAEQAWETSRRNK